MLRGRAATVTRRAAYLSCVAVSTEATVCPTAKPFREAERFFVNLGTQSHSTVTVTNVAETCFHVLCILYSPKILPRASRNEALLSTH